MPALGARAQGTYSHSAQQPHLVAELSPGRERGPVPEGPPFFPRPHGAPHHLSHELPGHTGHSSRVSCQLCQRLRSLSNTSGCP